MRTSKQNTRKLVHKALAAIPRELIAKQKPAHSNALSPSKKASSAKMKKSIQGRIIESNFFAI